MSTGSFPRKYTVRGAVLPALPSSGWGSSSKQDLNASLPNVVGIFRWFSHQHRRTQVSIASLQTLALPPPIAWGCGREEG